MITLFELLEAVVDIYGDPKDVTIFKAQFSIVPIIDYRLSGNHLHLIHFDLNGMLEDVVTLQELLDYVELDGLNTREVTLDSKEFEFTENRILLF